MIDGWCISGKVALRKSLDLSDDKSTLVQVMAWCHQATSHYLSQCWPRALSPHGVIRPQWVNPSNSVRNLKIIWFQSRSKYKNLCLSYHGATPNMRLMKCKVPQGYIMCLFLFLLSTCFEMYVFNQVLPCWKCMYDVLQNKVTDIFRYIFVHSSGVHGHNTRPSISLHVMLKCQDYVCVKWEYWSTMWKIKHYLRHENKVIENKVSSYYETVRYMLNNKK